ncbi:MAG: phytanoyl-CoA dioxygenase family protein [Xenococcaceae cyanobacterium]
MLSSLVAKIKRSPQKIKREIYRIPILKDKQDKTYQKLLQQHAPFIPKLNNEDNLILETLQKNGTCVVPISSLKIASTNSMLEVAANLVNRLKSMPPQVSQNDYRIDLIKSQLIKHPEIFMWGLEEKLLNIIESYIGLPVIYQGLTMNRDIANGKKVGIRRWHLDWEDRRMIKIIIYLNDVDTDGGPYEYIPQNLTLRGIESLKYDNVGFVSDEEMDKAIPRYNWQTCVGQAGTVVITDTSNVFHRAKPTVKNDRFTISLCYTSVQPNVLLKSSPIAQEHWQVITSRITQRQRSCLYIPAMPISQKKKN